MALKWDKKSMPTITFSGKTPVMTVHLLRHIGKWKVVDSASLLEQPTMMPHILCAKLQPD